METKCPAKTNILIIGSFTEKGCPSLCKSIWVAYILVLTIQYLHHKSSLYLYLLYKGGSQKVAGSDDEKSNICLMKSQEGKWRCLQTLEIGLGK